MMMDGSVHGFPNKFNNPFTQTIHVCENHIHIMLTLIYIIVPCSVQVCSVSCLEAVQDHFDSSSWPSTSES